MTNPIVQVNVSIFTAPMPATLQETGALVSVGGTILSPNNSTLLTQLSDLTPWLPSPLPVTSQAEVSTAVTVTVPAHGYPIGDQFSITIAGAKPAGYNGTFLMTAATATTFTYTGTAGLGTETAPGTWINNAYQELVQMATTFFAQGNNTSVYVLELGPYGLNDGAGVGQAASVTVLSNYLTANPNSSYTPGATGYFYSFLIPREWTAVTNPHAQTNFNALIASYENNSARTYFWPTLTLDLYANYTSTMKCLVSLIEDPTVGVWPANVLTGITSVGANPPYTLTGTTTTAHQVAVGDWFQLSGFTPTGYNGWHQAQTGTTGSTLVWYEDTFTAAVTTEGTLVAQFYSSAGTGLTEFSLAAAFWVALSQKPSPVQPVTPLNYAAVFGVTPFLQTGNQALITTIQNSNTNIIGTGAEGGISGTIMFNGETESGVDFLKYWYGIDWAAINLDLQLANTVINGSVPGTINPLFYNQHGIDRLQATASSVMGQGITYGIVLGNVALTGLEQAVFINNLNSGQYAGQTVINCIPFITYSQENPGDYAIGRYAGMSVAMIPQLGFAHIVVGLVVSELVGY